MIRLLDKDEHARKIALEAGNKASNEALKLGTMTPAEISEIAKQEMLKALKNYKPSTVTVERGVDKAAKIRDLFIEEENIKEGIFTHELEINDLLPVIRGKIQSRDFIQSIQEMTTCKISNRGTFVEEGKRAPIGQKKQYLHIEGSSQQNVVSAFNEIKRQIDEMQQ